jgi:signal transduction histidine kinase
MNTFPKPPKPANEIERLKALRSFNIIDTEPEEFFDKVTELASYICGTSMALVTFIEDERQWFKSKIGIDGKETTRDEAFCAYAIHQSDTMVVSDPLLDDRFANNPLVTGNPNIRFYAGAPLITSSGHGLGTLCVLDSKKIELSSEQLKALDDLRDMTMKYMELQKRSKERAKVDREMELMQERVGIMLKEIDSKNAELQEFSKILAHDFRAPLRGIASLADWIVEDYADKLPDDVQEQLILIKDRTLKLNELLDSIIEFSKSQHQTLDNRPVDLLSVLQEVIIQNRVPEHIQTTISGKWPTLKVDRKSIEMLFANLLTNSVKFNDKEKGEIEFSCQENESYFAVSIKDNGIGIREIDKQRIFDFSVNNTGSAANGLGVGLPMVKRTVSVYGGEISVDSEFGKFMKITITFPTSLEVR